jgi:lipopolysaccharide biosynthesis regulator YciM
VVGVVLVVAVATGGIWGREQARARAASESAELARVYVQGLDARQMLMP